LPTRWPVKPREGCVHWFFLGPDKFLRAIARSDGPGLKVGFVYLCGGRCKKCGKKKRWERVSWVVGFVPRLRRGKAYPPSHRASGVAL
jgi:hypothetical protein